ncbi:MAG: hypothetical protein IK018_04510 [Lachnospiraceae bacterium]|nr:hypothetical protein [Lachnospiraceae bacterium]
MGFVKEFRDFHQEMPEWQYLTDIGVRDMFGDEIERHTAFMVLDRIKKFFLIPQGHTGVAYTDEDISFYMLCLDGKKVQIEAVENSKKNADTTIDTSFDIREIRIIDQEIKDIFTYDEIIALITDAFEKLALVREDEYRKNGNVRFTGLDESKFVE